MAETAPKDVNIPAQYLQTLWQLIYASVNYEVTEYGFDESILMY